MVGLYKTELIRRRGPWRTAEQVELATADWWNRRRLHGAASNLPRTEYENPYHDRRAAPVRSIGRGFEAVMILFIDTNVFLSFYHFTSDDLDRP